MWKIFHCTKSITIAYCRQIVAMMMLSADNGNHKIEDPLHTLRVTTLAFHDLTCGEQTNW